MDSTFNWAVLIAAIIAAVASVFSIYFSYQSSRKSTYINTITSERLRWMGELRDSVSRLCGLTYHWAITPDIVPTEKQNILKEIDRLRMLVKLQLTPDEPKHEEIKALVDGIPENTDPSKHDVLMKMIEELTEKTRLLLRDTWREVKKEAGEEEITKVERLKSWILNVYKKVLSTK